MIIEFTPYLLIFIYALASSLYALCIKISGNRLVFFGTLNGISCLLGLILVPFFPPPSEYQTYLALGASAVCYNAMLYFSAKSFSRFDMSIVTPMRMTVKFVILVIVGMFLFGETLSFWEYVGIIGVVLGLLIQINFKRIERLKFSPQYFYIILAAIFGTLQFTFDVIGIKSVVNPFTYISWLMFIGLPSTLWAIFTYKSAFFRLINYERRKIIASALLDNIGYACLLFVVYFLEMVEVVTLSYISIVIATALGVFVLKEEYSTRRIVSAFVIFISIMIFKLIS